MSWSVAVNADDYGLTEGTSRAILRAHSEGIVTATSAMAVAPAFTRTARWLDDAPGLAVGLHLVAVGEDPPLLGPAEIPSLVDQRGDFVAVSSMRFLPRLALGQVDPDDLRREFDAQRAAFESATGRRPTHVDTHHNLHLWPTVAEVVAELAAAWGVEVVRRPWSRRHGPVGIGVRRLARGLGEVLDRHGRRYPGTFFGIDEGGRLDMGALVALLQDLRAIRPPEDDAVVEIAVHPGEPGDPDLGRYPWPGARRDAELEALTSHTVREALRTAGFSLTAPGLGPVGPAPGGPDDSRGHADERPIEAAG